jgi:hypothetical protein
VPVIAKLSCLAKKLRVTFGPPTVSYENLLLDITLDLRDSGGREADVICRQRVKFLVDDAAVISSPVWGDGNQLAQFKVDGGTYLGEQRDGPRRIQLLGLDRPPIEQSATMRFTRRIRNGFLKADEYFESMVDRPTHRLRVTVLFPKARPPKRAYLLGASGKSLSQPRVTLRQGRASLRWALQSPQLRSVYSLRWAW